MGMVSYHRIVFSLEVGHRYADDTDGLDEQLQHELRWVPRIRDRRIGVLLDDYNAELPGSRQDAIDWCLKQGELDFVAFESDGVDSARELLDRAWKRLDVSVDRHRLVRNTRAETSSVLIAEAGRLCCPTLAACWVLARLGVEPYSSGFTGGEGEFRGDRTLTVLPRKYMRVELTVMDLLDAAGYRSQAKRVSYVFY